MCEAERFIFRLAQEHTRLHPFCEGSFGLLRNENQVDHTAQVMQQSCEVRILRIVEPDAAGELPTQNRAAQRVLPENQRVRSSLRRSNSHHRTGGGNIPSVGYPQCPHRPSHRSRRRSPAKQRRIRHAQALRRQRLVAPNQIRDTQHVYLFGGLIQFRQQTLQDRRNDWNRI